MAQWSIKILDFTLAIEPCWNNYHHFGGALQIVADIPWYTCCHQFGWDLLLTCEGWLAVASTHEKHLIYPWITVAIVYLPQERSSLFSPHVPADEPWHPKKSPIFESRRDHIYSYFAAQFQYVSMVHRRPLIRKSPIAAGVGNCPILGILDITL